MWNGRTEEVLGRGEGIKFWEDQNDSPSLGNQYWSDSIMAVIFYPPWVRGENIMGEETMIREYMTRCSATPTLVILMGVRGS